MADVEHKTLTYAEQHVIHFNEYANAAARTGASGLTASDVKKVALQTDNNSFWVLTDHDPVTWVQISYDPDITATAAELNKAADVSQGIELELWPTPSDHGYSGAVATMTVGENVSFGHALYMKSDGKWWKADADASSTMPVAAMAAETINADNSGLVLLFGFARDDSWAWTVGGVIYASTTAGSLTQTAPSGSGDQVQAVGVATHADRMLFNPALVTAEV
jgi:hypothetical protein